MTSANTYLGPKKASPASLVGHLQNSRREVGDLLRLLNQIPQLPFPPEGCQDCTYWLRSRGFIAHLCAVGALATPVAGGSPKTDFPMFGN